MKKIIILIVYFVVNLSVSKDKIEFFALTQNHNIKAIIFQCPVFEKNKFLDQAINDFNYIVFDLHDVLEYANLNKLTVILLIQDNYENKSPICIESPWTEAARVATAWVSYYFRFKNLNSYIIKSDVKVNLNDIKFKLFNLLNKKFQSSVSVEEGIANRVFNLNDLDNVAINNGNISSEKRYIERQLKLSISINPHELPELKDNQKRFFISGAAGFLGSHLVKTLLSMGHQVIGVDNYLCCEKNNLNDILKDQNFYFKQCDVCIPIQVIGPIDEVMHLASVPSPVYYYNLPEQTLSTGLYGTKNMLDLACSKKANFLFASTSEVYGDPNISPQPETYEGNVNTIGKRSQYDQSKRGGETLCMLYFKKYNLQTRIARIFNTYGPYMQLNDGRVITNFIEAILKNKSLKIYGNGQQTRSFCYVDDNIDGLIKLLNIKNQKNIQDYIFNIGNNNEITINELAQKVNIIAKKLFNKESQIEYVEQIDITDPKQRCPDLRKSNEILKFEPKVNLEEGLEKTFNYFKK